jgi:hypothetical protein
MRSYGSCGLAAPQVGVPLSIFMVEFSEKVHGEFSPEIRKSREMAIIPLKVSPSVHIVPSVDCGARVVFTTRIVIRIRESCASFPSVKRLFILHVTRCVWLVPNQTKCNQEGSSWVEDSKSDIVYLSWYLVLWLYHHFVNFHLMCVLVYNLVLFTFPRVHIIYIVLCIKIVWKVFIIFEMCHYLSGFNNLTWSNSTSTRVPTWIEAQVKADFATDGQSASSSWCRASLWGPWPDFKFFQSDKFSFSSCRVSSLTRGWACSLQCNQTLVRVPQNSRPYFAL